MRAHNISEVGKYGGIDLSLIQKYINFHYSVSLDLFGSELSTNAANYFSAGLKGRFKETDRADDHQLTTSSYSLLKPVNGTIVNVHSHDGTKLSERRRSNSSSSCRIEDSDARSASLPVSA